MSIKSLTIGKGWLHYNGTGFSLARVMERLFSSVKMDIPVGYQDQTGFHPGVKPQEKETKFPSEW
jgi:hypothetical protein